MLEEVLVWRDGQSGTDRTLVQAGVILRMDISPALGIRELDSIRLRTFDGILVPTESGASSEPLPVDSPESQHAVSSGAPTSIGDADSESRDRVILVSQPVVSARHL